MRLTLISCLLSVQAVCQTNIYVVKNLPAKDSFAVWVNTCMRHYNNKRNENTFWEHNLVKSPIFTSRDSMVYDVKFLTHSSGMLLWDATATFTMQSDSIHCIVSDLVLLKRSQFIGGFSYINQKVSEMQNTTINKVYKEDIAKEVPRFFKYFE